MIEVHCDPNTARCDGAQSLYPEQFAALMKELAIIAPAVNRTLCEDKSLIK
jgi:3-deoxy-7-phosphoheptulonate synthase